MRSLKPIRNLIVERGTKLIIEKGTVIILAAGVNLSVFGELEILGTIDQPVLFTSNSSSIDWGGIKIINSVASASNVLISCGGGNEIDVFGHSDSQPVIYLENSECIFDYLYLTDNPGKGLGTKESKLSMNNGLISRCDTGGEFHQSLINLDHVYIAEIPNNDGIFVDDDNDGFYFFDVHNSGIPSTVKNCVFINGKDDGIDHNNAILEVSYCWIEGFDHEGIACSNGNTISIFNSVISGCEQGIEAGYGKPQVYVDHCVLLDNDTGLRFGDSYDWGCSGQMNVLNSILYNNHDNILNFDLLTQAPVDSGIAISYSMTNDVDYDSSPFCISGIPIFDSDYFLLADSPGKGEGTNGSDMGLVKTISYIEPVISNSSEISLQQNFPNPFNPETTIQYTIREPSFVKLEVYDLLGKKLSTLVHENKNAGSYKTKFRPTNICTGILLYSLAVFSDNGKIYNFAKKMVYTK